MKSVKPPQGGSMKPRHIIKRSAAALALIGLLTQPAQAQLTTVDPAHIALQVQSWAANALSWAKDLEEWHKNITQWTSNFKSQLSGMIEGMLDTSNAQTRADDLDRLVTQMQTGNLCSKIKYSASLELCKQEQALKLTRAKRIVKALKDSAASMDKINRLVKKYNKLVNSASISSTGGESDTNKAKIESVAHEIDMEQKNVQKVLTEAQKDVQLYDSEIAMLHGLRVDVAKIQLEGQEPGLIDKLAVTAGVGVTLNEATSKYKNNIETIKSSKSNNNY
jgi:hypothetical protein